MAIASLNILFRTDITDFNRKLRTAERQLKKFGGQMQDVGKTMTRSLTLPILAIGAASVKMATEIETSFTKIETLVGLSGEAVAGFKEEVEGISKKTAVGTKELADALFVVTSAGLRGANAIEVLDSAAQASAIGLGETKDIARATTAILQAYGEENISAARATEILLGTVRAGNLEAADLAPVLGRVIGIASQLGISFEEVGASVATFTRLGVSSEEAITGLRGVMNSLLKETPSAGKALADVGMTFDELRRSVREKGLSTTLIDLMDKFRGNEQALAEIIPNVRALSAVLGTAGAQAESYAEIFGDLSEKTDNVGKGMERVAETSAFKFQEALNNLRGAAEDIGAKLLPLVVKLAEKVAALGEKWLNFSDAQVKSRIIILGVVAALGPLVTIGGKLVTLIPLIAKAWRYLNTTFIMSPIGAIIAGVALAVWGLVKAYQALLRPLRRAKLELSEFKDEAALAKFELQGLSLEQLIQEADQLRNKLDWMNSADQITGLAQKEKQLAEERLKILEDQIAVLKRLNVEKKESNELDNIYTPSGGGGERVPLIEPDAGAFDMMDTSFFDGTEFDEFQGWTRFVSEESRIMADELENSMQRANDSILGWGETYKKTIEEVGNQSPIISGLTSAFATLGGEIASSFLFAEKGVESFGDKIKSAAKQIIKSLISQGIAAIISNTLTSLSGLIGPLAIPAAAGAGAGATALFNAAVPALAGGGLAYGATLAMVGDNRNASIDPEVIAPLSKLEGMGGGKLSGEFRIRGRDLWYIVDEENKFRERN